MAKNKPPLPTVTCQNYIDYVNNPDSVTNPDLRIAIIRHAAACSKCLDLVFKKLEKLHKEQTDNK